MLLAAHATSDRLHALEHAASAKLHALEDAVAAQLPPTAARWPLFVFLAGACTCLFLSSVCHLFSCVSAVSSWLWRLDYAGIATLIACSFFPPVYYTFHCEVVWLRLYLAAITVGATATLVVSLAPAFASAEWRTFRAWTFSALGLFGVVPIGHQVLFYVMRGQAMPLPVRHAMSLEALMGFLYLFGAFLYAHRFPEKRFPMVFDYALHSHNIFHLLVVSAALVHVEASLVLLAWADHRQCVAPGS